jgi:hypothetical protein
MLLSLLPEELGQLLHPGPDDSPDDSEGLRYDDPNPPRPPRLDPRFEEYPDPSPDPYDDPP